MSTATQMPATSCPADRPRGQAELGWRGAGVLTMLAALWALGMGCSDPQKLLAEIPGTYTRELPASNGMHRIYTLELRPDFTCAMTRDYVNRGKVTELGTWTNQGSTIILTLKNKRTRQPETVMEFKWSKRGVSAAKWDENLFGVEGLGTFTRQ